jgi:8-oxo-dGTP pyrophosphatase MutT (NUDIX family)
MDNKRGNWTIKESKVVYKTPWLKVNEDKVIRPDGKDGIFTTIDILPGVSILPIDNNMNVYLSENFAYSLNEKIIVGGAGGGIEAGEEPIEAAKRELKEETGFTAKKWKYLGKINAITTSIISSPNYMFLAEELEEGNLQWDGGEDVKAFKVPLKTAVQWVMNGKITHAVAQTIILKADKFLNQKYG